MRLCIMDVIGHSQVYVSHIELATENLLPVSVQALQSIMYIMYSSCYNGSLVT
jgi:hypothetical protein